jgi:hypothetical protein
MSAKKLKTCRSSEENPSGLDNLVSAAALAGPAVLVRARNEPPPVFDHVSVTINRRLQQIHNIDIAGDLYRLHSELSLLDRATRTLVVLAARAREINAHMDPVTIRDMTIRFRNEVLRFLIQFDELGLSHSLPIYGTLHNFYQTFHSSGPYITPATPVTLGGPDVLDPAFPSTTQAPTRDASSTKNAPA